MKVKRGCSSSQSESFFTVSNFQWDFWPGPNFFSVLRKPDPPFWESIARLKAFA